MRNYCSFITNYELVIISGVNQMKGDGRGILLSPAIVALLMSLSTVDLLRESLLPWRIEFASTQTKCAFVH